MIGFNAEQLIKVVEEQLEEDAVYTEDREITIDDEDDLHDYLLGVRIGNFNLEEYDYFYYNAISLIPQIIDEISNFVDDLYDDVIGEQWRVYYSMIAIH